MLLIAVLVVLAAVAGLAAYAATLPDAFTVQRSTVVSAPPDRIFPYLDDFHRWSGWSPWEKLDPGLQRTFSGAPSGQGAVYAWLGNKKVGQGRMEILEADSRRRLRIKLDFIKPFEASSDTLFSLHPEAGGTRVTWAMTGNRPFLHKLIGVFMNMDRMVGGDFERGLASLKALAESAAAPQPA